MGSQRESNPRSHAEMKAACSDDCISDRNPTTQLFHIRCIRPYSTTFIYGALIKRDVSHKMMISQRLLDTEHLLQSAGLLDHFTVLHIYLYYVIQYLCVFSKRGPRAGLAKSDVDNDSQFKAYAFFIAISVCPSLYCCKNA